MATKSRSRRVEECLFSRGPCKAIRDNKLKDIRIETTKDHPEGEGLILCRMGLNYMREAQAIVGLHGLLKAARPFATLGMMLQDLDGEDPLMRGETEGTNISVGDAQRIALAYELALLTVAERVMRKTPAPKGPAQKNVP